MTLCMCVAEGCRVLQCIAECGAECVVEYMAECVAVCCCSVTGSEYVHVCCRGLQNVCRVS